MWFPSALRRLPILDRVAVGLFLTGLGCVGTGLLPAREAEVTIRRILPLLLFLGTVIVLAELTAAAEVFDIIAARIAITARGSYAALFGLCVLFASVTTMVLNLDTTAVLLTPVMLALGRKLRIDPTPLAMTTVWLANTASLLLPVSNLTNLLAAHRVNLTPLAFAHRMWLPQLAAIATTMAFLWSWYWRRGVRDANQLGPLEPHRPGDRHLAAIAFGACVLFITALLVHVPIGAASSLSAGIVLVGFLLRGRDTLRPALVPWRLLVFVTGLFLVVQTIGQHGLDLVVGSLIGVDDGVSGAFRAAATGAVLSNAANNLPSYVAGEAVIPAGNHTALLALLLGTNVGSLGTPWASLATLLWYERCRAANVVVPMRRFLLTGAGLATACSIVTVAALLVTQ